MTSYGGTGLECGGAGTILYRDRDDASGDLSNRLIVDNDASRDECVPLEERITYADLSDLSRGADSFRTYIHDIDGVHEHTFAEVGSHLVWA